jgi:hypothetical protein
LLSIASRSSPLARARRAVSARAAAMAFNTPVASSVRPRFVTNQVANASPRKAFESGDRQAERRFPPFFASETRLAYGHSVRRAFAGTPEFTRARDEEKRGRAERRRPRAALRPERTLERPHASRIGRSLSRTHTQRGPRETLAHRRTEREVGRPSRWGTPSTRRMKSWRRLDRAPTARCTRPGREARADSWR